MKACVDIGGTKVAVCLAPDGQVDDEGRPVLGERLSEPTIKEGAENALSEQVLRLLRQAFEAEGIGLDALDAVGVASFGPFLKKDGAPAVVHPPILGRPSGPGPARNDGRRTASRRSGAPSSARACGARAR